LTAENQEHFTISVGNEASDFVESKWQHPHDQVKSKRNHSSQGALNKECFKFPPCNRGHF